MYLPADSPGPFLSLDYNHESKVNGLDKYILEAFLLIPICCNSTCSCQHEEQILFISF